MEGDRNGGSSLCGDLTGLQVDKTAESLPSCSHIHRWTLFEREGRRLEGRRSRSEGVGLFQGQLCCQASPSKFYFTVVRGRLPQHAKGSA